jgi:hypothetical protein
MINFSTLNALLSEDLSPWIRNPGAPEEEWTSIAARAMLEKGLSKMPSQVSKDADFYATLKFLFANEKCGTWDHDSKFESSGLSSKPYGEYLLGTFANKLYHFFMPQGQPLISDFGQIFDRARHGPGTAFAVDGTDTYTKMCDSILTTTSPTLYRMYSAWCMEDPRRNAVEATRAFTWGTYALLRGSRMFYVPKESDISRTATKGPSLNVYGQLGVGEIIAGRLKSVYGIDLSDQPMLNRDLAYMGSLFDGFATIDLRAASDSIARPMLRKYLPPTQMGWLELFGESVVEIRSFDSKDQSYRPCKLDMMSTMGNGFTFPLETALFTCVVSAVYDLFGVPLHRNVRGFTTPDRLRPGNFGVFGDDIIVLPHLAGYVIELLDYLGFQTNTAKTFVEGPFRESCGCDYHGGKPVRPVFIGSVDTVHDLHMAINAFNIWTARTGIPLRRTVEFVYSVIMKAAKPHLVPMHEADDAGLRVPYDLAVPLFGVSPEGNRSSCFKALLKCAPKRVSKKLRKTWAKARYDLWSKNLEPQKMVKYLKWESKPYTRHISHWYIEKPSKLAYVSLLHPINSDGLLSVCIGGHVRQDRIAVRGDDNFYRLQKRYTPNWDALAERDPLPVNTDAMSEADACRVNLQFT